VTVELSPGPRPGCPSGRSPSWMPDEDETEPVEPEAEASEPVGENRR
jgi:hypothetical protein